MKRSLSNHGLWTGWNFGKRFHVLAIVPFNFNHQQSDEGISDLKGLGDVVGLNAQLPIAQNFAQDQTKQKIKGMMHVSYAF